MTQLLSEKFVRRSDARRASRPWQKLIIVGFAGGGGTCRGIEKGLGRAPDIAINHDRDAIEMHKINHPGCRHIETDILGVDPLEATRDPSGRQREVGLAWFSPDCTHFSQAKGGTPVKKEIRDLAWVVVRWAKEVKPDRIMLENVREFLTWGPLMQQVKDGIPQVDDAGEPRMVPDPAKRGTTFAAWRACLEELGYVVDWRILRACDYGVPTTRPRLYLIARRDGLPIVWPKPSHGPGTRRKYRTAAECIDWSLPCPSIFLTRDEAKAVRLAHGVACNRPLAENTLKRIANGLKRYVLEAKEPFIVGVDHSKSTGRGTYVNSINDPLGTVTSSNGRAVVAPTLVQVNHGGDEFRGQDARQPLPTVSGKHGFELVAPTLIQYNTEKGAEVRGGGVGEPLNTVPTENRFGVVAAFLSKHYGNPGYAARPGIPVDGPLSTVTACDHHAVTVAHLLKLRGSGGANDPTKPIDTICAGAPTFGVVATFLSKHYTGVDHHAVTTAYLIRQRHGEKQWQGVDEPASTVSAGGNHLGLIAPYLAKLKGTSADGQPVTAPLGTVLASGKHFAAVYAFLIRYYGTTIGQSVTEPLYTITGADRFGLVTVTIGGQVYAIADIGMRMLQPRELLNAQFTPEIARTYVLTGTKTSQVHKIGNSVCPPVAAALVSANCPDLRAKGAA